MGALRPRLFDEAPDGHGYYQLALADTGVVLQMPPNAIGFVLTVVGPVYIGVRDTADPIAFDTGNFGVVGATGVGVPVVYEWFTQKATGTLAEDFIHIAAVDVAVEVSICFI